MGSFFLYFSVANGEPPIGIPWETFQKYIFAYIASPIMKGWWITMMNFLTRFGARLWEKHGYWIDKEHNIVQMNYDKLPLLGKIGYNLMIFGLKHDKKLNQ